MKKLLCLSLMLFSSVSFAVNDDEIEEVCDELYEKAIQPIYDLALKARSDKLKLSAKTDKEATEKLFKFMKSNPVVLKEMAYAMAGDIKEAKQAFEILSTFHQYIPSIFYNSQGNLRSLKDTEGAWTFQCYNGRMEKLFEYLESLED